MLLSSPSTSATGLCTRPVEAMEQEQLEAPHGLVQQLEAQVADLTMQQEQYHEHI